MEVLAQHILRDAGVLKAVVALEQGTLHTFLCQKTQSDMAFSGMKLTMTLASIWAER